MSGNKMPSIGIPRALLYYRYGTLWEHFLEALGVPAVLSPESSRGILETGIRLAPDESCLSLKMFMGHVEALIGRCERIFIPRYSNFGYTELFCPRYEGLYDQARNIFLSSGQRFITCNIDAQHGSPEPRAFEQFGAELGFSARESLNAWQEASEVLHRQRKEKERAQRELAGRPGLKVLVAGHDYTLSDPYLGKPILDYLEAAGVIFLRTDALEPETSRKACARFSPTCRWIVSEEVVGGVQLWKDQLDGIILVSAFPCGPDSMTNELLIRRTKGVPVLTLMLDAQSGTAGLETRLESFLDIIRFQKGETV
jgi:predicted nucleotide-binding protein (sugar kinase/HSP70/actin superfamily)